MRKLNRVFILIIYLEMLRRNKLAVLFTAAINNAAQASTRVRKQFHYGVHCESRILTN